MNVNIELQQIHVNKSSGESTTEKRFSPLLRQVSCVNPIRNLIRFYPKFHFPDTRLQFTIVVHSGGWKRLWIFDDFAPATQECGQSDQNKFIGRVVDW